MKDNNRTFYEFLAEMREDVTMGYHFAGGQEEAKQVCYQLEAIAAENGDKLPQEFEINVAEGNLLCKIREFLMKIDLDVKKLMIGPREDETTLPIVVTLR